jgi:hypothetical protein
LSGSGFVQRDPAATSIRQEMLNAEQASPVCPLPQPDPPSLPSPTSEPPACREAGALLVDACLGDRFPAQRRGQIEDVDLLFSLPFSPSHVSHILFDPVSVARFECRHLYLSLHLPLRQLPRPPRRCKPPRQSPSSDQPLPTRSINPKPQLGG